MTHSIKNMLVRNQLIDLDDEIYVSIRMLGHWGISVHSTKGRFYHLKVAGQGQLEREYSLLNQAYQNYSEWMSEPLGCFTDVEHQWIVSKGIGHHQFPRKLDHIPKKQLFLIFDFFFGTLDCVQHSPPQVHVKHGIQSDTQLGQFPSERAYTILNDLPIIWQHGDMTANNLGLLKDGLVFFDWEDYARVCWPGFDIFVLIASFCEFNMVDFFEAINKPLLKSFLNEWFGHLQLNHNDFRLLIPLYLHQFKQMKQELGYSESVIHRVSKAILQIHDLMEKQYA